MYKQYLMVLKFEQIDKPNVKNQNHPLGRGFFLILKPHFQKRASMRGLLTKNMILWSFVLLFFQTLINMGT